MTPQNFLPDLTSPIPEGIGEEAIFIPERMAFIGLMMAKAVASVGFPKACEESHHVHAGIGTDLEFGLTQYTKRARTLQHYLGDAPYHRSRMARLMNA